MNDEKMNLEDALMSLDNSDDAHWTKDGKPNLNVIKEKVGKVVSRKEADEFDVARVVEGDDADQAAEAGDKLAQPRGGKYTALSNIKEGVDGKVFNYKKGDSYKGPNAKDLMAAGAIK